MQVSKPMSGRKVLTLALLSITGGLIGMLAGRGIASALQTTPAWLGPAIFIGSVAILLIGFLLLPTAIRVCRESKNNPNI